MANAHNAPLRPEQQNAPASCKWVSGQYGVKCQRDADHVGQHRYETPDGQQGISWDHMTDEPPTARQLVSRAMNAAGIDASAGEPDHALAHRFLTTWQGQMLLSWANAGCPYPRLPFVDELEDVESFRPERGDA